MGESLDAEVGMNVVVLNSDGSFQSFHKFHTFHAVAFGAGTFLETAGSRALSEFLEALPEGTLVMVGAKDEPQSGLCQKARDALKMCGAEKIDDIAARDSYALIGIKGGEKLAEAHEKQFGGGAVAEASHPPVPEDLCPEETPMESSIVEEVANEIVEEIEAPPPCTDSFRVTSKAYSDGDTLEFVANGEHLTSLEIDKGMNMVVLNRDGSFHSFRNFHTFHAAAYGMGKFLESEGSRELVEFVDRLPDGTIAMVGVKDEAQSGLCQKARGALKR